MKLKWYGIEYDGNKYFYWFDYQPDNGSRRLGLDIFELDSAQHCWLSLWFFNIGFSFG